MSTTMADRDEIAVADALRRERGGTAGRGERALARAEADQVTEHLVQLADVGGYVHALLDTTQAATPYVSAATRAAIQAADEGDRRARTTSKPLHWSLSWMRDEIEDTGMARVNIAGNLQTVSLEAEVAFTIRHHAGRCDRALRLGGRVCPVTRITDGLTIGELAVHLDRLAHLVPANTLRPLNLLVGVNHDLQHLVDTARQLVDGPDQINVDAPCPHCGRRTLVADRVSGVITCGRDPKTGHNEPCRCNDPICQCHQRPTSYRHSWTRQPGAGGSGWKALIDRITTQASAKQARVSSPSKEPRT